MIERLAKGIKVDRSVVLGIGDDAAVIKWTRGKYLLFASDMIIEDVHFRLGEAAPFQIGWKALAVNLSDIAAMGGVPKYALVSIGLNSGLRASFVDGIYRGIKTLADRFKVNIVGGDTNSSRKLIIDISVIGFVERPRLVTRSGARPQDAILMTGAVGGSIKGRHLKFIPRVREARRLVEKYKVNSMIDISDGLILDLGRVLKASSCGAVIYENAIPLSKEAGPFKSAVRDGEDFELLFTMPAREAERFLREGFEGFGTDTALIGEVVDRRAGFKLIDKNGRRHTIKPEGFVHFA